MSRDRKPFAGRVTMPHTLVVVMLLVIIVLAASWVIPSGEYQRMRVETSQGSRNVTVARTYREVPKVPALALRRDGARPGDVLLVSGWPGEAAAGLEALRDGIARGDDVALVRRYRYAEPRLELGRALRGQASSAMDVSDGLLGDLGKLCKASAVGARLDLERLPVSGELAHRHSRADCERLVLFGGDDYELLFTMPSDRADAVAGSAPGGVPVHRIGVIEGGSGARCERDGRVEELRGGGYDHFA